MSASTAKHRSRAMHNLHFDLPRRKMRRHLADDESADELPFLSPPATSSPELPSRSLYTPDPLSSPPFTRIPSSPGSHWDMGVDGALKRAPIDADSDGLKGWSVAPKQPLRDFRRHSEDDALDALSDAASVPPSSVFSDSEFTDVWDAARSPVMDTFSRKSLPSRDRRASESKAYRPPPKYHDAADRDAADSLLCLARGNLRPTREATPIPASDLPQTERPVSRGMSFFNVVLRQDQVNSSDVLLGPGVPGPSTSRLPPLVPDLSIASEETTVQILEKNPTPSSEDIQEDVQTLSELKATGHFEAMDIVEPPSPLSTIHETSPQSHATSITVSPADPDIISAAASPLVLSIPEPSRDIDVLVNYIPTPPITSNPLPSPPESDVASSQDAIPDQAESAHPEQPLQDITNVSDERIESLIAITNTVDLKSASREPSTEPVKASVIPEIIRSPSTPDPASCSDMDMDSDTNGATILQSSPLTEVEVCSSPPPSPTILKRSHSPELLVKSSPLSSRSSSPTHDEARSTSPIPGLRATKKARKTPETEIEDSLISSLGRSEGTSNSKARPSKPGRKSKGVDEQQQGKKSKSKSKSIIPESPKSPCSPSSSAAALSRDEGLCSELCGFLVETLALSRASMMPTTQLVRTVLEAQPGLCARYPLSERTWRPFFERVLREAPEFGKVERRGMDAADRPLETGWFYRPDRDRDTSRAELLQTLMPNKRSEARKHKQYYFEPVGKMSRWEPEDDD